MLDTVISFQNLKVLFATLDEKLSEIAYEIDNSTDTDKDRLFRGHRLNGCTTFIVYRYISTLNFTVFWLY